MNRINVSEFKAVCLGLLERIRQTGEPVEILKNGELLAVVYPPPPKKRKKAFGAMKSSLKSDLGDLIEPLDVNWETLSK
jgi:antitoxin (DNA-binding transcriptional repressor) of toxin-antitoxin stability system